MLEHQNPNQNPDQAPQALTATDAVEPAKQLAPSKRVVFICLLVSALLCFVLAYHKLSKRRDGAESFSLAISAPAATTTASQRSTDKVKIEKGLVIGKILARYNLGAAEISNVLKAAAGARASLEKLHPGQVLEIDCIKDQAGKVEQVEEISTKLTAFSRLKVVRVANTKEYKASVTPIQFVKELAVMRGKIRNSLIVSAMHQGVPIQNLIEATNACSYEIDFQRDIKDGDSFEILVEKSLSPDDGTLHHSKTLYFALEMGGKKYGIYKFKPNGEDDEYFFTAEYQSAKRGLLKTPVQTARISSKFGMRKHPILDYSHMHRGVDFAAPTGTPIYAAGSGVIVDLGTRGELGNHVQIRHAGDLSTIYGHISRAAKGLKVGMRVQQGQVIAFVGMTGRATGPHLHYGLMQRGHYIDPLKFKMPSARVLVGTDRDGFKSRKAFIDAELKKGATV